MAVEERVDIGSLLTQYGAGDTHRLILGSLGANEGHK